MRTKIQSNVKFIRRELLSVNYFERENFNQWYSKAMNSNNQGINNKNRDKKSVELTHKPNTTVS